MSKPAPVSVLLVDDQPRFRDAAARLLASIPEFRLAAEADSGDQAVELAATIRPGLILMDIRLPGLSGIEACRQITREIPETTVVLVSTYHARDLPAWARDCGAAAYLSKARLARTELLGIYADAQRRRASVPSNKRS